MNAATLMTKLEDRGVSLQVRGDNLRFSPADAISSENLRELTRLKPDLIEIFQEREFSNLLSGMTDRLNAACPCDFKFTSADWATLDQLETTYEAAKTAKDLVAFKVALERYEDALSSMFAEDWVSWLNSGKPH
jgi:hypothetical protein